MPAPGKYWRAPVRNNNQRNDARKGRWCELAKCAGLTVVAVGAETAGLRDRVKFGYDRDTGNAV